jgi:1-acyl-sn-glycerol-3-phosphate acyltransferase
MATHDELTKINTQDLLTAFGLSRVRRGRGLLELLCQPPARRLARQILMYDSLVASAGLQVGGAWALGQYVRNVEVQGQHLLPRSGSVLIVSNHPGLYDTIALFAAIPRCDLRIVAADRPFLRALAHTSRYLITVAEATKSIGGTRAAARHLRSGGALLTFPGGRIEPDPAVLPGAAAALDDWSESISMFARLVADLTVVPVVVSGVLSSAALRHPLANLRGHQHRQLLAATLQVVFPSLQRGTVRVSFGSPIVPGMLRDGGGADVSTSIIAECRRLIERSAEVGR